MTGKEKSSHTMKNVEHLLSCPHCKEAREVVAYKSLICVNNHTFDLAKQGYVNLMTRPMKSQYDKKYFQHDIRWLWEAIYILCYMRIAAVIDEHINHISRVMRSFLMLNVTSLTWNVTENYMASFVQHKF